MRLTRLWTAKASSFRSVPTGFDGTWVRQVTRPRDFTPCRGGSAFGFRCGAKYAPRCYSVWSAGLR